MFKEKNIKREIILQSGWVKNIARLRFFDET
jgi:hypothetical protein